MSHYFISNDKYSCYGCKACEQKCPISCISMKIDNEGFWYPEINREKCVNCGLCIKVCPYYETSFKKTNEFLKVFAAINKNEYIKKTSSSGGVFTSLTNYIIGKKGVVFGAKYNDEFDVVHGYAEDTIECAKFKCSKYVQSDINTSYKNAEKFLKRGRLVLFSGTPCQIAGLYGFLTKEYTNLITIDFVCHGVPSPGVFNEYKKHLVAQFKSNIRNINFKDKKQGWLKPCIRIDFQDESCYLKRLNEDPYIFLWSIKNLISRPSCHKCKYTKTSRESDITIGDFWGIQNIIPEFMDEMGTSLLLINTNKGMKVFNSIKDSLYVKESTVEESLQPNMIYPTPMGTDRGKFFEDLNTNDFQFVLRKYTRKASAFRRIFNRLYKLICEINNRLRSKS